MRKSILIAIIVFFVCGMISAVLFSIVSTDTDEKLIDQKETVSSSGIDTLVITAVSSDVEIVQGEELTFHLTGKNTYWSKTPTHDPNLTVEIEASSVIAQIEHQDWKNFRIGSFNSKLVVTVPQGLETIIVETVSGNVYVEEKWNQLSVQSTSGDITVHNAQKANIETTSGSVQGGNILIASINSVSGDVDLGMVSKAKINTVSGDVTIQTNPTTTITYNTVSGDYSGNNPPGDAIVVATTSGDFEVN